MSKLSKSIVVSTAIPDFTVTIEGETYFLRYDFNALLAFQKETGTNPLTVGFTVGMQNFSELFWSGLHTKHPKVTLDQVKSWITIENAGELFAFIEAAFDAAFPEPPQAKESPADPPSA